MYELKEALACHQSISRLQSREQYHEFILSTFRLSLVCSEETIVERFGKELGKCLLHIATLLYEHYCSFSYQIHHNEWSIKLIQATLRMLHLEEMPQEDQLKITKSGLPNMEVKGVRHINTLTNLTEKELADMQSILDSYNTHLLFGKNNHKDNNLSARVKEIDTILTKSVDELMPNVKPDIKPSETYPVYDFKKLSTATDEKSLSIHQNNDDIIINRAANTQYSDLQNDCSSYIDSDEKGNAPNQNEVSPDHVEKPDEAAKCVIEVANIYTCSTSGSEMLEVYTDRLKTTMATLEEDNNDINMEIMGIEENLKSHMVAERRVHGKDFSLLLFSVITRRTNWC